MYQNPKMSYIINILQLIPEEDNRAANPMSEEMLLLIHWPQSTPVTSNGKNLSMNNNKDYQKIKILNLLALYVILQ